MGTSFRTRLVTGHVVLLALIAGTALTSIVALRLTTSRSATTTEMVSDELVAVEQLRFQAEQLVATSRGYLLTGNPSSLERFEVGAAELKRSVSALRERLDRNGASLAGGVEESATAYIDAAIEAARQRQTNNIPAALLSYFEQTLKPRRDVFESKVAEMSEYEREKLRDLLASSQVFAESSGFVLLVASLLAIGIGITLAVLVVRNLSLQYSRLHAAERAAQAAGAARDEILAVVSHDLRNPLNSISLASSLLEDSTLASGKTHLRVINSAADRMLHLINQILEADSLDAGRLELHIERCAVKGVFADVIELFEARAAALGVGLKAESPDEWMNVDRERVIEILSNLVGNALDHTPRGGAITLRAERNARELRLVVVDTGSGIPGDEISRVFERNWRSTQQRQRRKSGFGLGLYICKRLVDAHAGTIGVQSVPGSGSSFWFSLPAQPPARAFGALSRGESR